MMRLAVCEDNLNDLQTIKHAIDEAGEQLMLEITTDYFRSGEGLLAAVKEGADYPFILFDIFLENMNGLETARQIQKLLPEVEVAFLTSYKEYTMDAFELDAVHYLMKPVSTKKMQECLDRFCRRSHTPVRTLDIKTPYKTYSFPLLRVQKLQSSNKGVDIYIQGMAEPVHIPLALIRVEEQLDSRLFLKISRGLIVPISFILCIDKDICRLKDGTEALISRMDKANIRKKYNDWLFSKIGESI